MPQYTRTVPRYVNPPEHLKYSRGVKLKEEDEPTWDGTEPDYDYSLFRYSSLAFPFLLVICALSVIIFGLSLWQGSITPKMMQTAYPRQFLLDDTREGTKVSLRNLRAAVYTLSQVTVISVAFTVASRLSISNKKSILTLTGLVSLVAFVMGAVCFGLGLDQLRYSRRCTTPTFQVGQPGPDATHFKPIEQCETTTYLSIFAVAVDAFLCSVNFLLGALVIYTTRNKHWSWGSGSSWQRKQGLQLFQRHTIYTHVAYVRRNLTWIVLLAVQVAAAVSLILLVILREQRVYPRQVDSRNAPLRDVLGGWPVQNTRLRVALAATGVMLSIIMAIDWIASQRRWLAYIVATTMVMLAVGLYVVFGMDVVRINETECNSNSATVMWDGHPRDVRCTKSPFTTTVALEFCLALAIILFVGYEFVYRVWVTYDSFYFYETSNFLQRNAIVTEWADAPADDWQIHTTENYKTYFYSPSLGVASFNLPPQLTRGREDT